MWSAALVELESDESVASILSHVPVVKLRLDIPIEILMHRQNA
jgi:hypothetical protein